MNRFLIVSLATLLAAATACQPHPDKAKQMAALDNAYQAGLLTKDEYEAKKLALNGATGSSASTPTPVPVAPPKASPSTAAIPQAVGPTPSSAAGGAQANEPEPAPLSGCDAAEVKSGGKKGTEERFYAAPPDAVRRAAVSALGSLDFTIHKNSEKEIEASKKRHIGAIVGAGGERVILTFHQTERAGQSGTRVTGETKKSFLGHVAQKTWTDAVLAQIACRLDKSAR
jgi:hypothetical protein